MRDQLHLISSLFLPGQGETASSPADPGSLGGSLKPESGLSSQGRAMVASRVLFLLWGQAWSFWSQVWERVERQVI